MPLRRAITVFRLRAFLTLAPTTLTSLLMFISSFHPNNVTQTWGYSLIPLPTGCMMCEIIVFLSLFSVSLIVCSQSKSLKTRLERQSVAMKMQPIGRRFLVRVRKQGNVRSYRIVIRIFFSPGQDPRAFLQCNETITISGSKFSRLKI